MTKDNAMELDDIPLVTYNVRKDSKTLNDFLEEAPEEIIEEIERWYDRGLLISLDSLEIKEEDGVHCSSCEKLVTEDLHGSIKTSWIPAPYPVEVLCLDCLKKVHTEEVEPEIILKNSYAEHLREHPKVSKSTEEEIQG